MWRERKRERKRERETSLSVTQRCSVQLWTGWGRRDPNGGGDEEKGGDRRVGGVGKNFPSS